MINRYKFDRLYPAPPPTPEGMCWRTIRQHDGTFVTQLVPAEVATATSKEIMDYYDRYPPEHRDELKGELIPNRRKESKHGH